MYDFSMDDIHLADLNEGIPDLGIEFDTIMASMVLHWLSEPHEFLRQAKDMLSPAGRLIVVVPNITYYRQRIAYLFGKFPPISLSHKNFQVPAEVEQMFRDVGLEIQRRLTPKKYLKAKLWPTVFATDIVYILKAS